MPSLRDSCWLLWLLWLVPLFATARPPACPVPACANAPAFSVLAPQTRAHLPDVRPEPSAPRDGIASCRAGSSVRDRSMAEDPSVAGLALLPPPRLRLRFPGACCAPTPPSVRMGRGAGDLPPPSA